MVVPVHLDGKSVDLTHQHPAGAERGAEQIREVQRAGALAIQVEDHRQRDAAEQADGGRVVGAGDDDDDRAFAVAEAELGVEQAGAEEIVREALNEAARHAGIGIREMHMAYERHLAAAAAQRPAAQLGRAEPTEVAPVKGGGLTTPEEDLILLLLRHESFFLPTCKNIV